MRAGRRGLASPSLDLTPRPPAAIFCDYYNPPDECEWHYEPCGNRSYETCRTVNGIHSNISVSYLEGERASGLRGGVLCRPSGRRGEAPWAGDLRAGVDQAHLAAKLVRCVKTPPVRERRKEAGQGGCLRRGVREPPQGLGAEN